MGLFRKNSWARGIDETPSSVPAEIVYVKEPNTGNPDPENWKIVKSEAVGWYLVVKIKYPDCTNFEGNKILVFEDISLSSLKSQKLIDPHFFKSKKYKSPIARFEPTDRGWNMAIDFVYMMNQKGK